MTADSTTEALPDDSSLIKNIYNLIKLTHIYQASEELYFLSYVLF